MKLENSFEVAASPATSWEFMLTPDKVVPCMPGAELVEVSDDGTWVVKAKVKLGAVSLVYKGKVQIEERDDEARRIVMKGAGSEARGKGNVKAEIVSTVSATDSGGTRVEITTDMTISGRAAQFGRGMIADVSARFTQQFAEAMEYQLAEQAGAAAAAEAERATAEAERAAAEAEEAARSADEPDDTEDGGPDDGPGDAGPPGGDLEAVVRRAEAAAKRAESAAKKAEAAAAKADAAAKKADAAAKRAEAAQQRLELTRRKRPDNESVGGIGLMLWAVGRAIRRLFGRLFGGRPAGGATEES